MSGTAPSPIGITTPPIDDLLTHANSKYALVIYAAKRARQINAYYSQLQRDQRQPAGRRGDRHPGQRLIGSDVR